MLQGCGVSQHPRSTFVVTDPSEIVRALVGLKDVRVLAYERWRPRVELLIEQVVESVRCPACGELARVKAAPGRPLRGPAGLWHAHVAGLEDAPSALV